MKLIALLVLLGATAYGQEPCQYMTGCTLQDTVFGDHWKYRSYSVLYKYGKAELREQSFCFLDSVGDFLKRNPKLVVKIIHHGDRTPDKYCFRLGMRRAQAITDYLIKECGIDPRRLIPQSMSNLEPIISQTEINKETDKDKRMRMERINLRVEIVISGKNFDPGK